MTLSITILISAVVSLTLTPMMCARLLRERRGGTAWPLSRVSQRVLDRIIAGYGRSLQWVLQRQQATLVVTVATLVVTVVLFVLIPKGFFRSGHRRDPRHHGGTASGVVRHDGGTAAGFGSRHPLRSRPWKAPHLVYRCGWHEHDTQQRAHLYQP